MVGQQIGQKLNLSHGQVPICQLLGYLPRGVSQVLRISILCILQAGVQKFALPDSINPKGQALGGKNRKIIVLPNTGKVNYSPNGCSEELAKPHVSCWITTIGVYRQ